MDGTLFKGSDLEGEKPQLHADGDKPKATEHEQETTMV